MDGKKLTTKKWTPMYTNAKTTNATGNKTKRMLGFLLRLPMIAKANGWRRIMSHKLNNRPNAAFFCCSLGQTAPYTTVFPMATPMP